MGGYPSALDLKRWLFGPENHSSKCKWAYKNPVDIEITDIKGITYVAFHPTIDTAAKMRYILVKMETECHVVNMGLGIDCLILFTVSWIKGKYLPSNSAPWQIYQWGASWKEVQESSDKVKGISLKVGHLIQKKSGSVNLFNTWISGCKGFTSHINFRKVMPLT